MPRRARTSPRRTRKAAPRSKPLVTVVARLEPGQAGALLREAKRRNPRARTGRGHADVSDIIREALSVWMAIRPSQRAIIRAVAARNELTGSEVLRKALDTWITSLEPGEG